MSALIPSSLTGGFLDPTRVNATGSGSIAGQFAPFGGINIPSSTELQTFLTSGIFRLTEPKVSAGLFERVRQNISQALQLGRTQRVELGLASIDISQALSEQVAIREQQLARTQEQIRNQSIALGQINERLSRQVTELGQSIGGFDPVKFFTDNPIIGGIGIGGLLVGGVVLLILLRR